MVHGDGGTADADGRDPDERVADVLTAFATRRTGAAADLLTSIAALPTGPGPAASARIARLVAGSIEARQADLDVAVSAVADVLAARGAPPQEAHDRASSLVRQLETLASTHLPHGDLGRAARVLAAVATGADPAAEGDVRATQEAWQRLDQARRATLPGTETEMRQLLTAGPEALERHRDERGLELGVDRLREEFVQAWQCCLG